MLAGSLMRYVYRAPLESMARLHHHNSSGMVCLNEAHIQHALPVCKETANLQSGFQRLLEHSSGRDSCRMAHG
jgi:hypothetical protein